MCTPSSVHQGYALAASLEDQDKTVFKYLIVVA